MFNSYFKIKLIFSETEPVLYQISYFDLHFVSPLVFPISSEGDFIFLPIQSKELGVILVSVLSLIFNILCITRNPVDIFKILILSHHCTLQTSLSETQQLLPGFLCGPYTVLPGPPLYTQHCSQSCSRKQELDILLLCSKCLMVSPFHQSQSHHS